jgi:RNase P subunit RPR2
VNSRKIRCPGCEQPRALTRAASARLRDHKHPATGLTCSGAGMFECEIINERKGDTPKRARLVLVRQEGP